MPHIRFYLFIAENALSLEAIVTGITNMSFESESVNTCGNNNFETIFFQNFSRIFKSVWIMGFKTSHTTFTCSKKSSMLYLIQRVTRNRCKAESMYYELGQNYYKSRQLQLLQIGTIVITNRGNSSYYKSEQSYYKLGKLLQIGAEQ